MQKQKQKTKQNKKHHPQPREGGDEILSKLQLFHREKERHRDTERERDPSQTRVGNFIES